MVRERGALKVVSYGTAKERRAKSTAISPIATERFPSVEEAVRELRPAQPLYCMHPDKIEEAAKLFIERFPGKTFYAVKSNPDRYVLQKLGTAGIRHFDVASMVEIKLVKDMFPDADLAFMNTAKSREAIAASYFDYGVKTFVCDSFQELQKIRQETNNANDLSLFVRLGLPKGSALHPLSGKFGASPELASELLKDASRTSARVGLSFHVGSQTMDPSSYVYAIQQTRRVLSESGVKLDILDIGGGFPVPSSEDKAPPLARYLDVIQDEIKKIGLPRSCELWAEPGTALCGRSTTLVLRVELRKEDALHLNDGGYGALFDCCWLKAHRDMRVIYAHPERAANDAAPKAFKLYGPTCDSADTIDGPIYLPEDIDEGDFIVVSDIGAYGLAMQSGFNGFYSDRKVEICSKNDGKIVRMQRKIRRSRDLAR